MKIYTKQGDLGETGLFGGERVAKDNLRIRAYGTLDELNAEGALGRRELLSHDQFKVLSRQARAIVRTGECQPYCNIVLVAGVTF